MNDDYLLKPLPPKTLNRIKKIYYKGAKVQLVKMEDYQAPKVGAIGTVIKVDEYGSVKVLWDNGIILNVLNKIDKIRRI